VFEAVIVVYLIKDDIKTKRLGWAGHVIRMDDERIPKIFLMRNSTTYQWKYKEKNRRTLSRRMDYRS